MDLISGEKLEKMTSMEKIRLILDKVKKGKIVVLESGLTPAEEVRLIEMTMTEIRVDEFSGIEIESYPSKKGGSFFDNRDGVQCVSRNWYLPHVTWDDGGFRVAVSRIPSNSAP